MGDSITIIIAAMSIILLVPAEADAYVDPGSVSILLQMIAATVVGALFTFRSKMAEILRRILKRGTDRPPDSE